MTSGLKNFCSVEDCRCEVLICCNTNDGIEQLCMSPSCLHPAYNHCIQPQKSINSDNTDSQFTEKISVEYTTSKGKSIKTHEMIKQREMPSDSDYTKSSYAHINAMISGILEYRKKVCDRDHNLRLKTIDNLRVWLETHFKDKKIFKARCGSFGGGINYLVTPTGLGTALQVQIGSLSFDLSEFEYS